MLYEDCIILHNGTGRSDSDSITEKPNGKDQERREAFLFFCAVQENLVFKNAENLRIASTENHNFGKLKIYDYDDRINVILENFILFILENFNQDQHNRNS